MSDTIRTCALVAILLAVMVSAHGSIKTTVPSHWDDLVFQNNWLSFQTEVIAKARAVFAERSTELGSPSNSTCETCTGIIGLANTFIMNETNLTKELLDQEVCDKKFANKTSDKKLCYLAVDVIIDLARNVLKGMDRIHWALEQTICADILHKCQFDCCATPSTPEQIHLSFADSETVFTDNNGRMTVSWLTTINASNSAVQYCESQSTQDVFAPCVTPTIANATTSTYTNGGWNGVVYTATLTGLKAGTSYQYQALSGAASSKTFTFNTFPLNIGTEARPLRLLQIADMGFMAESDNTIERMREAIVAPSGSAPSGNVDMVLHYGDIGYADGDEAGWDYFGRKLGDITAVIPYMTTPGNHELLWNFTSYRIRLGNNMPRAGDNIPSDGMFYQLTVNGKIGILMLDSETMIDTANFGDLQLGWMKNKLETMKANQNMIITTHHRPLYCTAYPSLDCTKWSKYLRKQAEQLYFDNNVAMCAFGHLHDYERTYPVYNGNATQYNNTFPSAPIYVTNGAAGNREGQTHFEREESWSALRTQAVGFMLNEIAVGNVKQTGGRTGTMNSTFFQAKGNTIVDHFILEKKL